MEENKIVIYQTEDGQTQIDVRLENEMIWLTRQQLADLFGRDYKTISKHINNALKEELADSVVVAKFANTTQHGAIEGKTQTHEKEYFNLEMVTSVGYRVKSKRGVQFRKWANRVLKEYLVKGYAVNERIRKDWFAVGDYKRLPNEVGGQDTCEPEKVHDSIGRLIEGYNAKEPHTLEDILDFHVRFEKIHPFQDGNGRVGRLVMFKECLRSGIVPFIITDELKMFYYRGLREWGHINGYLTDTCLTAQDHYKAALDYFRIKYE